MCLICMKYIILFLIIIIISLGQILVSYIANTSRTHERTNGPACAHAPARTRAYTPSHTHTPSLPYRYSMGLCQPTVRARSAGDNSWSLAIETNTALAVRFPRGFECFSHIQKCQAELTRELVRGCTVRRYEQLETSV